MWLAVAVALLMQSSMRLIDDTLILTNPPADSISLARDLSQALLVHDESIQTLSWSQTLYLRAKTPDELRHDSSQMFDDRSRWFGAFRGESQSPDGIIVLEDRMFYDGSRVIGLSDTNKSGTVQEYAGHRRNKEGIDCWLGRNEDISGQMRLGETLLASPDLHLSHYSSNNLPVVACTADMFGQLIALLEVEIDPEHDFAPRSITIRDRAIRLPYYHYEILEFVRVDDTWLPKRGRLVTRKFQPDKQMIQRFQEAQTANDLHGDIDVRDPAVQKRYLAALRAAFNADEAPSQPLVPPMEVEARDFVLNKPIDAARFIAPLPQDYFILDIFHDMVKKAGSDQWTENPR